ncbi:hypothetical protein [Elizabethkingia sp. JS20170427COW]|uniref:hypothetical protein n=1 Tax=Elizabethkingia sp. JS20170427COW TaxID=2583851 RepID=UPI0011101153|nr:hypothetical protein [Elizabethkingia sp. JS20170427COW]QCX52830.1 hypothetical protein FGE20_03265 [Elizabethkingia sp. JS20170427COW]
MALQLYNPFKEISFQDNKCFLSGEETSDKMSVFPEWLMQKYKFAEDEFEMMDKMQKVLYQDLQLPCSALVKEAFEKLDSEVELVFNKGYEAMLALESLKLFQWIGRIIYGVLYYELTLERKRHEKYHKEFGLSPLLKERFGVFHLMMQSIIYPVYIKDAEVLPWTIKVLRHKFSTDIFSYRDDAINLIFNLRVQNFGIIACLQDNGAILNKEQELLDTIGEATLHPIQFEELYARFHYSNYLQQYKPNYRIEQKENEIWIEALPVVADEARPIFGFWDEDMFAQVLANYWDVYGFQKNDIYRYPQPIKSYLTKAYTGDFILPESIKLPF